VPHLSHCGFDSQHVFDQAFAVGIFPQQGKVVGSAHEEYPIRERELVEWFWKIPAPMPAADDFE
jgi:hypothetical protein